MASDLMTRHRLVGRAELRKMLGVSHTRTIQISERADFPPPMDQLSVGKIWLLDDVIAWAEGVGRQLDLAALDAVPVQADEQ